MTKEQFRQMLQDPDICKEIFDIVRNGGKPVRAAAPAVTPAVSAAPGEDKLAALRQKLNQAASAGKSVENQVMATIRQKLQAQQQQAAQAAQAAAPAPAPETPSEEKLITSMADKLKFLRGHVTKVEEERVAAEEAAKAAGGDKAAVAEKYTIVMQRPCPICEEQTRVVKTKSRLNAEKKDLDYCVHYKDFNPYLYTVWACEHCGFAAEEKKFLGHFPNKIKEKLRAFLKENDMALPFVEVRTAEEALSFFELDILFSELTDHSQGRQAKLYLNMAWICRYEGLEDKEREYMEKAAECFENSLNDERWPIDGMTDDMAVYLCGAIYYMLGDLDRATVWLGRTINNANLRSAGAKIYEQARDIWQEVKRLRKEPV